MPKHKKHEEIVLFEDDNVKLFWEHVNKENLKKWKQDYEENKKEHLINFFLDEYKIIDKNKIIDEKKIMILFKLFEWDIRTIKFLTSIENNKNKIIKNNATVYFYFLKIFLKKAQKYIYLGFIVFIDNFYPYHCNEFKCNNFLLKQTDNLPFIWYIYSHYNYKSIIKEIFKKEISFIHLCDNLIYLITKSKIYWLKSDSYNLLNKVYTNEKNFFEMYCDNKYLTALRKKNSLYRCKIISDDYLIFL